MLRFRNLKPSSQPSASTRSRSILRALAALLAYVAGAFVAPPPAAAATLPSGFYEEPVYLGLDSPVTLAFAPSGRAYVGEKSGLVWAVETDGTRQATPVIDLREEVNSQGDRGLVGLAVDPDFANNPRIFLLYIVDPVAGSPDEPAERPTWGRLTRYTLSADGLSVVPGSRTVLLGDGPETGFPICYTTHGVGTLAFAPDGALLASAGEGAHYDYWADYGQDLSSEDPQCEALFGGLQDIGAFRAQSLQSLAGKIVRIDPDDGLARPDNPYFIGDYEGLQDRIWASGMRNPWRFTVRPATGAVWIGDVGEARWEELDVSIGGENFGWPCYEGPSKNQQYFDADGGGAGCETIETVSNPGPLTTASVAWHHSDPDQLTPPDLYEGGFTGATALAGVFYTADLYPTTYRGRLFLADFTKGWIRVAGIRPRDEAIMEIDDFASDIPGPVDLKVHPINGDLYYLSIYTGELVRIAYTGSTDEPPTAVVSASPSYGYAPLAVQFSSAGSVDPDGSTLIYHWRFGDGAESVEAAPTHTYTVNGVYTAELTVSDPAGQSATAAVSISVGNTPPQASILSPEDGSQFHVPGTIALEAEAIDAESPASLAFEWRIDLHHGEHVHPDYVVLQGAETSVSVSSLDEDCWLEVHLRVTDTGGLRDEESISISPDNQAPVIDDVGPQQVRAGNTLVLPITATDPDGDAVRIDGLSLPSGSSFGDDDVLRWTPAGSQVGSYLAVFEAVDVDAAPKTDRIEVPIEVLPASGETVQVVITSDWGAGFCADLKWVNGTGVPVDGWSMDMPLDARVFAYWNGVFSATPGGYHIGPEWYNTVVDPGVELLVGFCADGSGRPGPVTLNLPSQVDVTVTSSWVGGYCADLTWINDTGADVTGWTMTLELDASVYVWWNGVFTPIDGGYRVTPETYNQTIPDGAELLVGYCAEGEALPTGMALETGVTSDAPVAVTYTENGDWGTGSCGEVTLQNLGSIGITGWEVTFTVPQGTDVFAWWTGELTIEDGVYHVTDVGWNAYLEPEGGQPQGFGLCMDGTGSPENLAYVP